MAQPLSPSEQTDTEEAPIPLHDAYAACEAIVRSHYENFPVASRFLTPARRNSLAAIYAFARRADDVADAAAPSRERLEGLNQIESALHRALDGAPSGPAMGRVVAGRGHMTLLPVGAAYQFHAERPGVILLQTQEGPDTVLRWADIIQTN